MVFGIGSGNGSYGKWEFSKNTPNELGKWYIKLTKENDPIFKLEVSGEQPEYFIGLDFYVKDNIKGTEWTKVSDGSNMGIDNFNKNLEALLTKYPLIGNFKGNGLYITIMWIYQNWRKSRQLISVGANWLMVKFMPKSSMRIWINIWNNLKRASVQATCFFYNVRYNVH